MVVAAEDDGSRDIAISDSLIEGKGNLGAALAIGIEDSGLRTYYEVISTRFLNPMDIIMHLPPDLLRSIFCNFCKDFDSKGIALCKILWVFRHADPPERAETVVEIERAHYILDI